MLIVVWFIEIISNGSIFGNCHGIFWYYKRQFSWRRLSDQVPFKSFVQKKCDIFSNSTVSYIKKWRLPFQCFDSHAEVRFQVTHVVVSFSLNTSGSITSCIHTFLSMSDDESRFQMAMWQSYPMAMSRKQLSTPKVRYKTRVTQPGIETSCWW